MFGLDFIKKLKPCKWRYTGDLDDGREHFGFIAQEVEQLAPQEQYGFVRFNGALRQVVYSEFIGPMVKAIQELEERISRLEAEKGRHDNPVDMGDNQTGNNDPVGSGHDMASDLGDLRNTGKA